MAPNLFAKFPTMMFRAHSLNEREPDLEMGVILQASPTQTVDLEALAKDKAVVSALWSAPEHLVSREIFGAMPTTPAKKTNKLWNLGFLSSPIFAAIAAGIVVALNKNAINRYSHCRDSVCAGFGNVTWPVTVWDNGFPSNAGYVSGNLTQVCLDTNLGNAYRNNSVIQFDSSNTCRDDSGHLDERLLRSVIPALFAGLALGAAVTYGHKRYVHGVNIGRTFDDIQQFLAPELHQLTTGIHSLSVEAQTHIAANLSGSLKALFNSAVERQDAKLIARLIALCPSLAHDTRALEISIRLKGFGATTPNLLAGAQHFTRAEFLAATNASDMQTLLRMLGAASDVAAAIPLLPQNLLMSFCAPTNRPNGPILPLLNLLGDQAQTFVRYADRLGRTPLHMASHWGQDDSIQSLLDFGADPLVADHFGKLAQDLRAASKL